MGTGGTHLDGRHPNHPPPSGAEPMTPLGTALTSARRSRWWTITTVFDSGSRQLTGSPARSTH